MILQLRFCCLKETHTGLLSCQEFAGELPDLHLPASKVCDPEDRCHLFRWRLAPDARCKTIMSVQRACACQKGTGNERNERNEPGALKECSLAWLRCAATSRALVWCNGLPQASAGRVSWIPQERPCCVLLCKQATMRVFRPDWLRVPGWCIRGQHFNDAGEVLGSFGAMRQREPDPWEPAEEASDRHRSCKKIALLANSGCSHWRSHMEFQDWADGLFFSLDREGKEQLLDADGQQARPNLREGHSILLNFPMTTPTQPGHDGVGEAICGKMC